LLTTEKSDKAKGSIRELAVASKMMFLAKKRESIPKELGLDLLILKEEKLKDEQFDKRITEGVRVLDAEPADEYAADPKGYFKILLDRAERGIILIHYSRANLEQPDLIIRGKNAADVYKTAVKRGLLSTIEHAAYLGSEVEKAEVALKLGRSYTQDTQLF
ncbi:MAG: dihydropteroate synthase-like protein, partial [Nitrososphaerales archaeon]